MKAELVIFRYQYESGDDHRGYSTRTDIGTGIVLTRDQGDPSQLLLDDRRGKVRSLGMRRSAGDKLEFAALYEPYLPIGDYVVVEELSEERMPQESIAALFTAYEAQEKLAVAKARATGIIAPNPNDDPEKWKAAIAKLKALQMA